MRFNLYACVLGLAFFQQATALDVIDDTEYSMPEYELIKQLRVCQTVPQELRRTYFDKPIDLPTARGLICDISELIKQLEDEEKENLEGGLENLDDFGFGCSLWNDKGCGRRV
ncbi:hypothetical protein INS49_015625 [Diaporthe citri]|uniref:uncharacterized protein n=1 Tax=Diaporthe citri TaxID=83186 RepID=UPI001C7E90F7|nr:uncharacterized protein INS49_015625 [Diaporthe citri]KAG6356238.1 hypothetical protein INS49_015625 [Diaporthe citri]